MTNAYFDVKVFLAALDEVRQARDISWYQFFHETGIQKNNIRKGMSVHTLATLILWSGLDPLKFMKRYDEVPA